MVESLRYASIMKNTSYMIYGEYAGTTSVSSHTLSGLIHLNGSTDYVKFQMYTQFTSSVVIIITFQETQHLTVGKKD